MDCFVPFSRRSKVKIFAKRIAQNELHVFFRWDCMRGKLVFNWILIRFFVQTRKLFVVVIIFVPKKHERTHFTKYSFMNDCVEAL